MSLQVVSSSRKYSSPAQVNEAVIEAPPSKLFENECIACSDLVHCVMIKFGAILYRQYYPINGKCLSTFNIRFSNLIFFQPSFTYEVTDFKEHSLFYFKEQSLIRNTLFENVFP